MARILRKNPDGTLKATGTQIKYQEHYPNLLLEFFDVAPYREVTTTDKDRNTVTKKVANTMPTLAGFCAKVGCHKMTISEWSQRHPEFADAVKNCKEKQEQYLQIVGMEGLANVAMTIFMLKNLAGYRDNHSVEHTGADGGDIKTSLTIKFADPTQKDIPPQK